MNRLRITLAVASCIAIAAPATDAATIIKLGFSTDSLPDIEILDNELSTFDDDFGATIGDQNTEVTFLDVSLGPPGQSFSLVRSSTRQRLHASALREVDRVFPH